MNSLKAVSILCVCHIKFLHEQERKRKENWWLEGGEKLEVGFLPKFYLKKVGVGTNGRQDWGPSYLSVTQVLETFFWTLLDHIGIKFLQNGGKCFRWVNDGVQWNVIISAYLVPLFCLTGILWLCF